MKSLVAEQDKVSSQRVFGVGINDANYAVLRYERLNGKRRLTWVCPFYQAWKAMLRRCYDPRHHEKFPTYADCEVCPEWLSFTAFRAWMKSQDWAGKHLDKDILRTGNRLYCPDACAFVDPQLNTFVIKSESRRGDFPHGARWHKKTRKFEARCRNPFTGKRESLGYFESADDAHEAWCRRKQELACQFADMQSDPRVAQALREGDRYVV